MVVVEEGEEKNSERVVEYHDTPRPSELNRRLRRAISFLVVWRVDVGEDVKRPGR